MITVHQKLNDGFFDVMMKVACGELMDKQIAGWDTANTGEHTFSPEFERKMKKLMRGQSRMIRTKKAKKALSRAAIVILAVMAVGFTFTMSVQALRVQFFSVIREFAEEYIGFSFSDRNEPPISDVQRPSYVPEGYYEIGIQEMQAGVRITYRHDDGSRIYLKQENMSEGSEVRIDGENIDTSYVVVFNGIDFQVYEGRSKDDDSYVIWETDKTFYQLFGTIQPQELIAMAKSIIK